MRSACLAVFACMTAVLVACGPRPRSDSDYTAEIESARRAKDAALAGSADSPVPADRRSIVLPLSYYQVDPAFAVPAGFEDAPGGSRSTIEVETSTNQPRRMERVGVLRFTLAGRSLRLSAFCEPGDPPDRLFVPFADETSGRETYPAGRYLEIQRSSTGVYLVDFNRAFNPYCYYNPTYDCPLPPRENRLPVAIRAGERVKPEVH